ncbi:MAG: phosphopantetheine-binding protein [Kiritimatiellia bacterium]
MNDTADRDTYNRVKQMLVRDLRLKMAPEDIADDAGLFQDGLGLDSVDALELVVALEKEFGVRIPDSSVGSKVLVSVKTVVDYIRENQSGGGETSE